MCSYSNFKCSFYKALKAMYGKVGRCAFEEVIVELLKLKVYLSYFMVRILPNQ